MKKKEPAWKAELKSDLHMADLDDDPLWPVIEKHIVAAEQRGFQAGVNRTGDSVGKLREQLKTAGDAAFREAAEKIRREMHNPNGSYDASRWNYVVALCADSIDPDPDKP